MTHLLSMLRDAGVVQVMDWTLFQNKAKNVYFLNNEGDTANTEVYVKFDGNIQKYTFSVTGKWIGLTTEVNECIPA